MILGSRYMSRERGRDIRYSSTLPRVGRFDDDPPSNWTSLLSGTRFPSSSKPGLFVLLANVAELRYKNLQVEKERTIEREPITIRYTPSSIEFLSNHRRFINSSSIPIFHLSNLHD